MPADPEDALQDWYFDQARLDWKVAANPYAGSAAVLERGREGVVGSATTCGRPVSIIGLGVRAAEIGDTFTHPAHRRQGVFSRCVRAGVAQAVDEGGAQLIYGCPNDQSLPGYVNKLGFAECPAHVDYLARFVTPADLRRQVVDKLHVGPRWISGVGSSLLWAGVGRPVGHSKHVRSIARPVECFPASVDGDWGDEWRDFAFVVTRSATYLNWRFFEHPNHADYRAFGLWKDDGSPIGYYVVRLSKRDGVCECALLDLMTPRPRDGSVADALLDDLETRLTPWRVDVVKAYLSRRSPYFRMLVSRGFQRLRGVPVIVSTQSPAGEFLAGFDGDWHFTLADCDHR